MKLTHWHLKNASKNTSILLPMNITHVACRPTLPLHNGTNFNVNLPYFWEKFPWELFFEFLKPWKSHIVSALSILLCNENLNSFLTSVRKLFMGGDYSWKYGNSSSIYGWSIGHTLEHEFFCLGRLGSSGSKGKRGFEFFWATFREFFSTFLQKELKIF